MTASGQRLAVLLGTVLAIAVAISLLEGTPERLPAVSLGSNVLLHTERAGAIFVIVLALISVVVQATRGRLPTQLSTGGLAYEAEAAADTKRALEELQAQIDDLESGLEDVLQTLVFHPHPPESH